CSGRVARGPSNESSRAGDKGGMKNQRRHGDFGFRPETVRRRSCSFLRGLPDISAQGAAVNDDSFREDMSFSVLCRGATGGFQAKCPPPKKATDLLEKCSGRQDGY